MATYNTIAESNNFIILDDYTRYSNYMRRLLPIKQKQRWSRSSSRIWLIKVMNICLNGTLAAMLANVRVQLQQLNDMVFTDGEWARFVEEYLDKPSDNLIDKARKIHENYIYDFVFDDGHIKTSI